MLWYKSWLETRWRFLIGLGLLTLSACGVVVAYREVLKLMPLVPTDVSGPLGQMIRESAELSRTYRGYVWGHWFRENLLNAWTLFAVLLGAGGLLSQAAGGGRLFTLSLPATRNRLAGVRAATGLAELLVLAVVPSMVLLAVTPAIGESYRLTDALVHSVCLFIGGAVFFNLTFLLSTAFGDVWRPIIIAISFALALGIFEGIFRDLPFSLFRVMSAEVYFRGGGLPWSGLVISIALSAALLFAATKNFARQDF
jgi:hypothetical protein